MGGYCHVPSQPCYCYNDYYLAIYNVATALETRNFMPAMGTARHLYTIDVDT